MGELEEKFNKPEEPISIETPKDTKNEKSEGLEINPELLAEKNIQEMGRRAEGLGLEKSEKLLFDGTDSAELNPQIQKALLEKNGITERLRMISEKARKLLDKHKSKINKTVAIGMATVAFSGAGDFREVSADEIPEPTANEQLAQETDSSELFPSGIKKPFKIDRFSDRLKVFPETEEEFFKKRRLELHDKLEANRGAAFGNRDEAYMNRPEDIYLSHEVIDKYALDVSGDVSHEDMNNSYAKLIEEISSGNPEDWDEIKDMKIVDLSKKAQFFNNAEGENSAAHFGLLLYNIDRIGKYEFGGILREKAEFVNGEETINEWATRIIRETYKSLLKEKK